MSFFRLMHTRQQQEVVHGESGVRFATAKSRFGRTRGKHARVDRPPEFPPRTVELNGFEFGPSYRQSQLTRLFAIGPLYSEYRKRTVC